MKYSQPLKVGMCVCFFFFAVRLHDEIKIWQDNLTGAYQEIVSSLPSKASYPMRFNPMRLNAEIYVA